MIKFVKGINLIYGENATGKTTLAMQRSLEFAKDKKVVFIDTERGFSVERIKQMNSNYKKLLKNVFVYNPKNFIEQHEFIKNLKDIKNSLIILDTLGNLYRIEVKKDSFITNKRVEKQLRILKELSKNNDILILNQVYQNLDNKLEMCGGNLVRKNCDFIFRLEKNPKRKIIFEGPGGKEVEFKINDCGLVFL